MHELGKSLRMAVKSVPPINAFCTEQHEKVLKWNHQHDRTATCALFRTFFLLLNREEGKQHSQRSPLYASTRLYYIQAERSARGEKKQFACWMWKRKIDETSFGFARSHIHFIWLGVIVVVSLGYVWGKREAFNNSQNVFFRLYSVVLSTHNANLAKKVCSE